MEPLPRKRARFHELDSLRGIAALSVVIGHYFGLLATNAVPGAGDNWYLLYPNSMGHNAVILFFVLSGFVLALPTLNDRVQLYPAFAMRRVFRIYLPYLVTLGLALTGNIFLYKTVTHSSWFHQFWTKPINVHLVWQHVFFLGDYNTGPFDPPFWSLVHEMRLSLVFPFICALVFRLRPKLSMLAAFAFSTIAQFFVLLYPEHDMVAFPDTLHYAAFFILGICLTITRSRLTEAFRSSSHMDRILVATLTVFLYIFGSDLLGGILFGLFQAHLTLFADWPTAIGAGGLIVLGSGSSIFNRILEWQPIQFFGKISFSLYLLHFVVLLAFVHLLYGRLSLSLILIVCLPITIAIAWIYNLAVEIPCINTGRKLSRLLTLS